MTKKSRIRKLRTEGKRERCGTIIKLILLSLGGIIYGLLIYHPEVIENFTKNYHEQYNLLVHGRINYCSENVGDHDVISVIRTKILHQDEALNKVEANLRNHTQFTAIAIIGTTGVGKTLFSNLLMNYFPWQENIQHFLWGSFAEHHEKNFEINNCGHNLIVIDDLTPKDVAYVNNLNKKAKNIALSSKKRLILLYIFNIPSFLEPANDAYKRVSDQFKILEGIQTIPFRSFDQSHLSACIKNEAELLNISLNAEKILEIQNNIEAVHSGCKGVYAKLVVFSEAA